MKNNDHDGGTFEDERDIDYTNLIHEIEKASGIFIEKEKEYLIKNKLKDLLIKYKLKSFNELAASLEKKQNKELFQESIDRIAINESRFFREPLVFEALAKQIIPEWMEKNNLTSHAIPKDQILNIWSAGCSFGQEPISILIAILESLPFLKENIKILATDISSKAISYAQKGEYHQSEVLRGLEKEYLNKYFNEQGDKYSLKENYKKMIHYDLLNLIL